MSETDFSVYAMKLQPGAAEDWTNPYEFCKREEIIGVGWGIDWDREYESIDDVRAAHEEVHIRRENEGKEGGPLLKDGRLQTGIRYLMKDIDQGDFVWVNEKDEFALCKVTSDWKVSPNLPAEDQDRYAERDIVHFRNVEWTDVPPKLVPGYVRRKFSRPFGTVVEMNKGISDESKRVIQSLHGQDALDTDRSIDRERIAEKIEEAELERIFNTLGSDETEDIVISYLQSQGWRIVKSSTSSSEAKIECKMLTEDGGEAVSGYLQVKTGSAGLDPDSYEEYVDSNSQVMFFVQSGLDVSDREGMTTISPGEIRQYMISDYNYLPSDALLNLDYSLD